MRLVPAEVSLWHAFLTDFVPHPGNWVYLLLMLLLGSWTLLNDPDPVHLLWFGIGWVAFLPQEYWTHVYILHARPPRSPGLYRHLYRLHYGHHDLPRRSDLMYIPLWLTLPMLAANALAFGLLAGEPCRSAAALCGLMAGYLLFEWTHLFCHLPYHPKTALGRRIRRLHLHHHSHNETRWFAVSAPALFMDRVCGTDAEIATVPRTGRGRLLGLAARDPRLLAAREHYAGHGGGDPGCSRIWLEYLMASRTASGTEVNPS